MIKQIKKLKENKLYWILVDYKTEIPYFFNTKDNAKKFAIENKIKEFSIGKEGGN